MYLTIVELSNTINPVASRTAATYRGISVRVRVDQEWADQSGADALGSDAIVAITKVKTLLKIK